MAYNKKNWEINKNKLLEIQKQKKGGDKEESSKRTFKIVELNGNVVDFGHLTIKRKTSGGNPGPGPVVAARKALQSISKYLKVSKTKLNAKFMLQEITRGKTQYKIYGPYVGHYIKYTQKEIKEKKIKLGDGEYITLEYKPVVKLDKTQEIKNNSISKSKKGGWGSSNIDLLLNNKSMLGGWGSSNIELLLKNKSKKGGWGSSNFDVKELL